jgi:AcrR family transcriptional regulator
VSPRSYNSPGRDAAASQTKERIVAAAAAILGSAKGVEDFSLEAVAKAAGVTRLTVYNQFGSRRAVLEAVFDAVAVRGGLHRLVDAMAAPDPHAALARIITIFCEFWSFDPGALGLLHAVGSSNPEFAESISARNERRRRLLAGVIRRIAEDASTMRHAPLRHASLRQKAQRDLVDVLFALTSFTFFAQLTTGGRTAEAACRMVQGLAQDAVRRAMGESGQE